MGGLNDESKMYSVREELAGEGAMRIVCKMRKADEEEVNARREDKREPEEGISKISGVVMLVREDHHEEDCNRRMNLPPGSLNVNMIIVVPISWQ